MFYHFQISAIRILKEQIDWYHIYSHKGVSIYPTTSTVKKQK